MECPEVHLFLLMLLDLPVTYKETALWDKEDTTLAASQGNVIVIPQIKSGNKKVNISLFFIAKNGIPHCFPNHPQIL